MNNFCATILLAGVLLATLLVPATGSAAKDELLVYFGTFTKSGSKGIYLSRLDRETGKLSEAELAAEIGACGFLAIHPNKKYLYSVGDLKIPSDKPAGGVNAFSIDPKTGKLTCDNRSNVNMRTAPPVGLRFP